MRGSQGRELHCRPLGTLAAHVRKGFEIDGNFEATLDGQSKVLVTAVLERTAVYEIPYALWVGRQLARLDRFEVADPELLTYRQNKRWLLHANSATRGRHSQVPHPGRGVKVKPPDHRRCPGSNQAVDGDPLHGNGEYSTVTCKVCGSVIPTYPRQEKGRFRGAHNLPTVSECTNISMPSETNSTS